MEVLGSGLHHHGDGAAGGNTVVGAVVATEGLEFGQRIGRWHQIELAAASAIVGFAAVDQPVIMVGAHSVKAQPESTALRGDPIKGRKIVGYAGAERGERHHIAAIRCELGDLLASDEIADLIGFCLQMQSVSLDSDGLHPGADGKGDVFGPRWKRRFITDAVGLRGVETFWLRLSGCRCRVAGWKSRKDLRHCWWQFWIRRWLYW